VVVTTPTNASPSRTGRRSTSACSIDGQGVADGDGGRQGREVGAHVVADVFAGTLVLGDGLEFLDAHDAEVAGAPLSSATRAA
jgi:hypothetical protein